MSDSRRYWEVISPHYNVGSSNLYQLEPPEETCDYVVVEAPTKRAAIVSGVRAMRRMFPLGHVREAKSNDETPFKGVHAVEIPAEDIHEYRDWMATDV